MKGVDSRRLEAREVDAKGQTRRVTAFVRRRQIHGKKSVSPPLTANLNYVIVQMFFDQIVPTRCGCGLGGKTEVKE